MEREKLPVVEHEWQRGIPIERLREVTAFFREQHGRYVFGAFGLPKEAEVAAAMHDCEYAESRYETGALSAVAFWRYQTFPSRALDFTGNEIDIPGPCLRVHSVAANDTPSAIGLLISLAKKRRGGFVSIEPMVVEIFEEDNNVKPALEALGLHYLTTRISAGSEVKGIYCSNATNNSYSAAETASLAIIYHNFMVPEHCELLLEEAEAMKDAFAQHYSSYNKKKSWTSFALRGYDSTDPGFIIKPAEMSKRWKMENPHRLTALPEWTSAAPRCPRTMEVVQTVTGGRQVDRVRFMRLAPNGELSRHADITDRYAGVADGKIARLHIPLRTSDKVIFHGWGKRGQHFTTNFPQGAMCYLDQRGPHRVENQDPTVDRVHLVIDVYSDERLRLAIQHAEPFYG